MSVLVKLIQEREQWAKTQKAEQARRMRFIFLEFGLMIAIGLLVTVHYHKILAALMVWISL